MRNNSSSLQTLGPTIADGAVEGLLHGLLAGTIMAAYLAGYLLLTRTTPNEFLNRLSAAVEAPPLTIVAGHFALSAFYGVVWGILYQSLLTRVGRLPRWGWGLLYGVLLWLLSLVLLPAGLQTTFLQGGVAHLLFGLVLGLVTK